MNAFSTGSHDLNLLPAGDLRHPGHPSSASGIAGAKPAGDHLNQAQIPGTSEQGQKVDLCIIDPNLLSRSCMMRSLALSEPDFVAHGYRDVEEWSRTAKADSSPIILLCAIGQAMTQTIVCETIEAVMTFTPAGRVIIVSDLEDTEQIVEALEHGARGYLSMNSSLDVAVAAIRLIKAGGTFVPASGLLACRFAPASPPAVAAGAQGQAMFTQRQLAVIDRLRKGESNKMIAYKLNMGECTVKVHIRNIMRKIKAHNRTEIAFLTNDLF